MIFVTFVILFVKLSNMIYNYVRGAKMIKLQDYKSQIKKVLTVLSTSANVDAAVFDVNCNLVATTDKYLKLKGTKVHTPPLKEVIATGISVVNNPGNMSSCFGCRFRGHCPSTIEILSSIMFDYQSIGVVSLTSFTKEGQKKIVNNINLYKEMIKELSNIIANFILLKSQDIDYINCNNILELMLNLSTDSFFVVDNTGSMIYCNNSTLNYFPSCLLNQESLEHILPKSIISKISEGKMISDEFVEFSMNNFSISTIPIKTDNKLVSTFIHIKKNNFLIEENLDKPLDCYSNPIDMIKGKSKNITDLKNIIKKISNSSSTVLITGETGTGKELFAKAIHYTSSRASYPFIPINCSSVPESLFESEFFGYEESSFTGAKRGGKTGYFELANKGTIFLDEIGELPYNLQSKLLRVLQERKIIKIGGSSPIDIDVRIIAATNEDIESMIEENKFRKDLYYRLNVIPIKIPPLKERKDDIEMLSLHFLEKYNKILNRQITGFSNDVLSIFKSYDWPGNVRELENIIEYAINMEDGTTIGTQSLPSYFINLIDENKKKSENLLKQSEKEAIIKTLDKYGWDAKGKDAAAKELGISVRTLYRKIN